LLKSVPLGETTWTVRGVAPVGTVVEIAVPLELTVNVAANDTLVVLRAKWTHSDVHSSQRPAQTRIEDGAVTESAILRRTPQISVRTLYQIHVTAGLAAVGAAKIHDCREGLCR